MREEVIREEKRLQEDKSGYKRRETVTRGEKRFTKEAREGAIRVIHLLWLGVRHGEDECEVVHRCG